MCQSDGGDLAVIRSQDENKFIFRLLKNESAWLGLKRNSDGKAFYWVDGTPLEGHFSARGSGEPNSRNEKCVRLYGGPNSLGKWNDMRCNSNYSKMKRAPVVLCQKRLMR